MTRLTFVIFCVTFVLLISYMIDGCVSRHIEDETVDDSDENTSEWESSEASDYHQNGYDKHRKNGENGYDEEHRYQNYYSKN